MVKHTVVRYRSAVTGGYVSEEYALANPDTTIKETEEVEDPGHPDEIEVDEVEDSEETRQSEHGTDEPRPGYGMRSKGASE